MRINFEEYDDGVLLLEDEAEYIDELAEETEDRIAEALEEGELTEAEAEDLLDLLEEDYEDRVAELEAAYEAGEIASEEDFDDDEYEYEEDGSDYSFGTDLATFAAAVEESPIAEILLTLGEQLGYASVEDLALDLADSLDLDDEEAIGLLTGEFIPDEEVCADLADAFGLDDDDYEELAAIAEVEALDAYDDEGGYGDEGIDDDIEALAEEAEEQAVYSRYQNARINQLEGELASFSLQNGVADRLSEIERNVLDYVDQGWMPPVAHVLQFGEELDREGDRVAAFSAVCSGNGVDLETQLYAMEYANEMFRRCFEGAPIAQFGAFVEEPITSRELEQAESISAQAKRNHAARKQARGVSAQ